MSASKYNPKVNKVKTYTSLAALVADTTVGKDIKIRKDITLLANINLTGHTLKFYNDAVLTISSGVVVTGLKLGRPYNHQVIACALADVPTISGVEYVTPEMFGAVGDGVTDDTSPINKSLGCGCSNIKYLAKTYLHSGVRIGDYSGQGATTVPIITRSTPIKMSGMGVGVTIIKSPDESNNDIFVFRKFNDIVIMGITFDGNKSNQTGVGGWKSYYTNPAPCLVLTRDCINVTITDCEFKDSYYFGYNGGSDCKNVTIEHNIMSGCTGACTIQGQKMNISKNDISDCYFGIQLEGDPILTDIDYDRMSAFDIFTNVSNNKVRDCKYGIYAVNACYAINIDNNFCFNCAPYGIIVNGSGMNNPKEQVLNFTISNNYIYGAVDYLAIVGVGLHVNNVYSPKLSNNDIRYSKIGIRVFKCPDAQLIGNISKYNQTNGLSILSDSSRTKVIGGKYSSNNTSGSFTVGGASLYIESTVDVLLAGVEITDDQTEPTVQWGIGLGSSVTGLQISDCNISKCISRCLGDNDVNNNSYSFDNNFVDKRYNIKPKLSTTMSPYFLGLQRITFDDAIPTTGSWPANSQVFKNNSTDGVYGWRCSQSGTFSALSVTGDTTNTSPTISNVSDTSGVNVDDFVQFSAGVTGIKRVINKTTTTLTLDGNASSNQTGVTITTPDPTFETFGRSIDQDFSITSAGKGIKIAEGTNARMGVAALVAGTVTVANTSVTANTRISVSVQSVGGTEYGDVKVSARVASTSFTITAYRGNNTTTVASGDTSVVMWELKEPA